MSSPVRCIEYSLSHRAVLKIKWVKSAWHIGSIKLLAIFIILSITQRFAAQATASLQTANSTLSSLTSLDLGLACLVRKLHSFISGSPLLEDILLAPQWCPLYHSCLLSKAPGLSAQLGQRRWQSLPPPRALLNVLAAHARLLRQNSFASSPSCTVFPPETSGPILCSTSLGTSILICIWVHLKLGFRFFPMGLLGPMWIWGYGLTSILRASGLTVISFPNIVCWSGGQCPQCTQRIPKEQWQHYLPQAGHTVMFLTFIANIIPYITRCFSHNLPCFTLRQGSVTYSHFSSEETED